MVSAPKLRPTERMVYSQTQTVAPVHPLPPHCAYPVATCPVDGGFSVAVVPGADDAGREVVTGADVVTGRDVDTGAEFAGLDVVAGADVGAADVAGALAAGAEAEAGGAAPAVSPKKMPRPFVPT